MIRLTSLSSIGNACQVLNEQLIALVVGSRNKVGKGISGVSTDGTTAMVSLFYGATLPFSVLGRT